MILTGNQRRLFDKVRVASRRRVGRVFWRERLTASQKRRLNAAKQKIERVPIVLNLNLRKSYENETLIDSLLRIKRLFNVFEIGDFQDGIYDIEFRTRLMSEFKLYGATRDLQTVFSHMRDSERPAYGALDYVNRPESIAPLNAYGVYRLVLKSELKERSTFTPTDSLMVERYQVYTWEGIDGVLATRLNGRFWFEYVLENTEPGSEEGIYYIEAQVLGGIRLSDIETAYYPLGDELDPVFF